MSSTDSQMPPVALAREDDKRRLEEQLRLCDAEIGRHPGRPSLHCRRAALLQLIGRPGEALQSYERAIQLDPGLAEAHHHKAELLRALRRFDDAIASYDRAIGARADYSAAWNNRARALRALGRLNEALQSCEHAIALQPELADCHVNRGNVLMELRRSGEALMSYERALAIKPNLAEAHYNRANAAARLGRQEEALDGYERTLALKPEFAEAHHARANTLERLGRLEEALESFDRASALKPDLAEAYNNKGNILCRLGRYAEAVDSYDRAVNCRPAYALAWNNRGSALREVGHLQEALESCDRAIALAPALATAHYNKGNVLKSLKRLPEAIQSFDRATDVAPDFSPAHRNRATTTLLMADFEHGWQLYERRNAGMSGVPNAAAIWTGEESLDGKTLLVGAEQGLGDTIQFCRYAKLTVGRGAKVTLAVQDPLVSLLKCLEPAISIEAVSAAPSGFDYYIALLSMPHAFRTRSDNIPSAVPYLRADLDRIRQWKARIGTEGFRIGISWQGAVGGEVDSGRSVPLRNFESLTEIPGVRLISLQKYAGVEQLRDLPGAMKVEVLGDALDAGPEAFVDTAAVMESLDLIITSDTAIAHLAGALGRPTWVALNHVPDWRWLLDRDDSPWYPTMKLFRQTARNQWAGVFTAMKASLLELLSTNGTDA